MKYESKRWVHGLGGSKAYRDNYEKIFGKKKKNAIAEPETRESPEGDVGPEVGAGRDQEDSE